MKVIKRFISLVDDAKGYNQYLACDAHTGELEWDSRAYRAWAWDTVEEALDDIRSVPDFMDFLQGERYSIEDAPDEDAPDFDYNPDYHTFMSY